MEVREEGLGDCAVYRHLDLNLVITHGAQIASSTHNEPEQMVRARSWVHGGRTEVLGRVCERRRPLHVDMLRYLPSTGVRSSATAHEEEDPSRGTHCVPKRARLPHIISGLKPSSFRQCCWRLIARRRNSARRISRSSHANQREPSEGSSRRNRAKRTSRLTFAGPYAPGRRMLISASLHAYYELFTASCALRRTMILMPYLR